MISLLVIRPGPRVLARQWSNWMDQLGPGDELVAVGRVPSSATPPGERAGLQAFRWLDARTPLDRAALRPHVVILPSGAELLPGALARVRAALSRQRGLRWLRAPEPEDEFDFPAGRRRLFGVPLRVSLGIPLIVARDWLARLPGKSWIDRLDPPAEDLWLSLEEEEHVAWLDAPLVARGTTLAPRSVDRMLARWVRKRRLDVELVSSRRTGGPLVRARRPRGIDIELTNRCNLGCTFCPRRACRSVGDMAPETFERVLDFIRDQPIGTIYFIGRGEPMVHPHFIDCVRRIRQRTGIHFEVFTNGVALTPKMTDALAELNDPELDIAVNVSLHSLQQETHRTLTGGDLRRVAANLRYLQTRADRLRVSYAFVTNKVNEAEMARLRRHLDRTGNTAWDISLVYNKGGLVPSGPLFDDDFYQRQANWDPSMAGTGFGPCWYSFCGSYYWVNYRGEFTLCHDDFLDETILGRVGRESLEDIDRRVRALARAGGAPRCSRCNKRLRELHHGENRDAVAQIKDRFRPRTREMCP